MDGGRFDDLARRFAVPGTRRRLLGGLLAVAAARQRSAAAQSGGTTPMGGACGNGAECADDGMGSPPICASNGIVPQACCRERGCCGSDADCCGGMLCAPTADVCSVCAYPPFPTKGLGAECTANAECIPTPAGIVVCGDNGLGGDGPANCCFEAGAMCTADGACCGAMFCIAGRCRVPGDAGAAVLEPCASDAACSQVGGTTVCGTHDRGAGCCRVEDQPCGHWDACCLPLGCRDGVCRYG